MRDSRKDFLSNRMSKTKDLSIALMAALLLAGHVNAAQASEFVSAGFNIPANLSATVNFDCRNAPGPTVTLGGGQIALGGIGAEITLSNNTNFTHATSVDVEAAVLLNMGATVQIPKQPSLPANFYGSKLTGTGVGGNPLIYAEFLDQNEKPLKDANGNPLGPIFLGRCVQGGSAINVSFLGAVLAAATISSDNTCSNNPGPTITISNGNISLSGISAKIIFTNNAKFTHEAIGDADVSLQIITPNGSPIVLPKQPVLGGVTGNPLVYFIFMNGDQPVGTWPGQLLGRCNKI